MFFYHSFRLRAPDPNMPPTLTKMQPKHGARRRRKKKEFAKCQCHVRFNDTNAMNRFRHRNCKFMCFPFWFGQAETPCHPLLYICSPFRKWLARTRKNMCLPVWLFSLLLLLPNAHSKYTRPLCSPLQVRTADAQTHTHTQCKGRRGEAEWLVTVIFHRTCKRSTYY